MTDWATHPYGATGFFYLLKPDIVFQAQVNMPTVTYPLFQLTYDNTTLGSLSACRMGMTLLLGSQPGLFDLGQIYVRAKVNNPDDIGDSTTIYVGFCSRGHNIGELNVSDNVYISVLDLYQDWKRASRMLDDGSVLKDYDWAALGGSYPVAHVGASRNIGMMEFVDPDSGALVVDTFDASTSYRTDALPDSSALLPVWEMKDGTFISGSSTDPAPVVSFPPGKRWIQLQAIYPDVAEFSLPRHYLIVALDGEDDPALIPSAQLARWTLKEEGLTFQIDIRTRLDPNEYLPGTVGLFLVDEERAGVASNLGLSKVKFAGWLNHQASFAQGNNRDVERGQTLYFIDDATRLGQLKALPSSVQRATIANNNNQIAGANIDRYWFWVLIWHTFATILSDVQWSGTGEAYCFMTFSSPGGNFYGATDNLAKGIGYRTVVDATGRLLMKLDPLRLPKDQRSYVIVRDLLPGDMVRLERVKNPFPKVGVMRATATIISNADASTVVTPFPDVYVVAPGDVEGQGIGESQNSYPWLAQSLAEAQARIGEDYERANADEDGLKITLAHGGDAGIQPLDWITVTTDPDMVGWLDDALDHEHCLVHQMDFTFDDEAQTMVQVLTVERETTGAPGAFDPIALGNTPNPLLFNFLPSDQGFFNSLGGTWALNLGWTLTFFSEDSFVQKILGNLPITSMTIFYTKQDGSDLTVNIGTFSGTDYTTSNQNFGFLDTNPAGSYSFTHAFSPGTAINGIYGNILNYTGNIGAAITAILVNCTGGCS